MSEAAARYRQAKAIFLLAQQRPQEARDGFLAEACAGDAALRDEVDALLEEDRTRGAALDQLDHTHVLPKLPPGYRIERELGRGGMGVVWLAERDSGDFKQRVALKLLGFDALRDPDRHARFRAERRILASLEHPHIARLIDGGALADGTPFLAMEFVDGERLDVWAERARPQLRDLLRLFVAICRAVQAAHSRLVVHRDLKPANILVDGYGAPKLLDFGIAKLLDDSVEVEVATGTGMQLLTPRYAAPEQVRGEAITTATDVYALGAVLYELLTGSTPFARAASTPDLLRAICDTEPVRPSAALAGTTQASGTTASNLRGDLDAVLLKCLRKEPGKRYRGAAELADDLEAFLDGRPVSARAGSTRYALGKFVARHRYLVASAVLVLGVLLAATVLLLQQLEETRKQRDLAAQERDRAEAVTRFMKGLFREARPLSNDGRVLTVRDAVAKGVEKLQADATLPSLTRGTLESMLADVTRDIGDIDSALLLADRAVNTLLPVSSDAPRELAEALLHRATLLQDKGRFDEAESDYRAGLLVVDPVDDVLAADLLSRLASLENDRDDIAAAAVYLRDSRDRLLQVLGYSSLRAAATEAQPSDASDLLSVVVANECASAERGGRLVEALELCEFSLALKRRLYPGNEGRLEATLDVIGNIHSRRGDHAEAANFHRRSLEIAERVYGPDHSNVAISLLNLGLDLAQTGDTAGGRAMYERSIAIFTARHGAEHRFTLIARNNLANLFMTTGDHRAALAMHEEVLAARRRSLGEDAPEIAESLTNIAICQQELGASDAAIASMEQALALVQRVRPAEHIDIQLARLSLAERLADAGHVDDALAYAELSLPYFQGEGDNALARASILFIRARVLANQKSRRSEALGLAQEALAIAERFPFNDRIDPEELRAWLAAQRKAAQPNE